MLIALALSYLLSHFGADSSALMLPYKQTEKLIKQDVADGARRKQALEIVDQMKAANKANTKQREKSVDALLKLLSVRETEVAAMSRAGEPLIADDRATSEKLVDLRLQLKSVLTANEWEKVFPAPATASAKKSP